MTRAKRRVVVVLAVALAMVLVAVLVEWARWERGETVDIPQITWSEGWPSWSPDGTRLAFVGTQPRNDSDGYVSEIYTMRPDGSDVRQLTDDGGLKKSDPAWSPDGARIAFVGTLSQARWNIYATNADGSAFWRLTDYNPEGNYGAGPAAVNAASIGVPLVGQAATDGELYATSPVVEGFVAPAWSPDGTRLAFATISISGRDRGEIFVLNTDGSGLRRLTRDNNANNPAWSPDGAHIAFNSVNGNIMVMAVDGRDIRQLTDGDFFDANPAWSPDGTRIAFSRALAAGKVEIVVTCADGSRLRTLTRGYAVASSAWSPDGTRVAYTHTPTQYGESRIRFIDLDETSPPLRRCPRRAGRDH